MINLKTKEQEIFVSFYLDKVGDSLSKSIWSRLSVNSSEEATHLSNFFWDMVDAAIQDEKGGLQTAWDHSSEFLSEKIMYAVSGYLESTGYEEEWEKVSDLRN